MPKRPAPTCNQTAQSGMRCRLYDLCQGSGTVLLSRSGRSHDDEHCSIVRLCELERTELRGRAEAKHCTVEPRHWSMRYRIRDHLSYFLKHDQVRPARLSDLRSRQDDDAFAWFDQSLRLETALCFVDSFIRLSNLLHGVRQHAPIERHLATHRFERRERNNRRSGPLF